MRVVHAFEICKKSRVSVFRNYAPTPYDFGARGKCAGNPPLRSWDSLVELHMAVLLILPNFVNTQKIFKPSAAGGFLGKNLVSLRSISWHGHMCQWERPIYHPNPLNMDAICRR